MLVIQRTTGTTTAGFRMAVSTQENLNVGASGGLPRRGPRLVAPRMDFKLGAAGAEIDAYALPGYWRPRWSSAMAEQLSIRDAAFAQPRQHLHAAALT